MRFENSNRKSIGGKAAFTLIELMISMALVVILLLGINQVFKMSSDVVGAGLETGRINRESRVLNILRDDIRNVPKDAPLFIIHSAPATTTGNFLNSGDRSSDNEGNPLTVDWNNNGIEGEVPSSGISERLSLAIYGDRNHRTDTIAFPSRGVHSRHTADGDGPNDRSFVSPTKSFDAWVWIGHVKLPDGKDKTGQTVYSSPGVSQSSTSPAGASTNLLAANWVVGRVNTLLKDESSLTINNTTPLEQYLVRNFNTNPIRNLSPLDSRSFSYDRNWRIDQSRYDLAGTTLEQFRQNIQSAQLRVIGSSAGVPGGGVGDPTDPTQRILVDQRPDRGWWAHMVYSPNKAGIDTVNQQDTFRYQCNPDIPRSMNSKDLAVASPYFVGNVSQFIVEYAGDFITQNNTPITHPITGQLIHAAKGADYGDVLDVVPDGETDFYVDWSNPANPVRRIRWYGLPRDINNDGVIWGYAPGRWNNQLVDVVPLRDVRLTALTTAGNYMSNAAKNNLKRAPQALFEKEVPGDPASVGKSNVNVDYAQLTFTSPQAIKDNFRYTCVWTNGAPPMVRVLMKVEDPTGRLREGQWWEVILDGQ